MIVFREGLEAVLIFAAVTASMLGANAAKRRPVVAGAAIAFGATVVTWFVVQALLDAASPLGPKLEAITGFIAIVVLLVVLNWFVHKVYWSQWIGRHHRRRSELLARTRHRAPPLGLVAARLHERLPRGVRGRPVPPEPPAPERHRDRARGRRRSASPAPRWSGCSPSGCTASSPTGKMLDPDRRDGRRRARRDDRRHRPLLRRASAGCPQTPTPFRVPEWMGSWFEIYPYWETIGARSSPRSWSRAPTSSPSTSRSAARRARASNPPAPPKPPRPPPRPKPPSSAGKDLPERPTGAAPGSTGL